MTKKISPDQIEMRFTNEPEDAPIMRTWFDEPGVLRWFPMVTGPEIDDSVQRWLSFSRVNASLTALIDGEVCGIATLYVNPYIKLRHQSEFGIIVSDKYRNRGIGSDLMKNLIHLAKNKFGIELLHLQVYEDNPAISLYKRLGFREFGRQMHWIKEEPKVYRARIFMECDI